MQPRLFVNEPTLQVHSTFVLGKREYAVVYLNHDGDHLILTVQSGPGVYTEVLAPQGTRYTNESLRPVFSILLTQGE